MTAAHAIATKPVRAERTYALPRPDALSRKVVAIVADTYGIDEARIWGRCGAQHTVIARHAAMWAIRQTGRSYPEIGEIFGRDHASAMNGLRQTDKRNRTSPYTLARNMAVLDAIGVPRPAASACSVFVGYVHNGRRGDFLESDRRRSDMCHAAMCGRTRAEHGQAEAV